MIEAWKDIPGFNGAYQVSDVGRIRRATAACGATVGKILKGHVCRRGYVRHVLAVSPGKTKLVSPHIAILEAFVGPRPCKFDASHKNGVKTDNRLDNLCWEAAADNHGRKREHGTLIYGERHAGAKLTAENVIDIRNRIEAGEKKVDLAAEYKVSGTHIGYIGKRRTWAHLS